MGMEACDFIQYFKGSETVEIVYIDEQHKNCVQFLQNMNDLTLKETGEIRTLKETMEHEMAEHQCTYRVLSLCDVFQSDYTKRTIDAV